ncbi:MAG TPA: hypothetical protein VFQ25_07380 [Ktedonobacterales bacterium]|nr:hypothetical protein [Ktedonobacterales bacterium]
MKNHLVWAALAALMLGMLSAPTAFAHTATAYTSSPCREADSIPLSTAQGKADALRILGPKVGAFVIAHMHQRFYPTCSVSGLSPNTIADIQDAHWGGYYLDETNQGTNTNAIASNFNAEFVTCSVCSMYE